jgi:hypothetical protein
MESGPYSRESISQFRMGGMKRRLYSDTFEDFHTRHQIINGIALQVY